MLRRFRESLLYRWRHWKVSDYPLLRARVGARIRQLPSFFTPALVCEDAGDLTVKVFCQVKDDADIIEDWILWHGHLFGLENVFIIADRPSRETKQVLRRYSGICTILESPLGVSPTTLSWCELKTCNLNTAIERMGCDSDFVVPLDADEFVIFEDKPDRQLVLREMGRVAALKENAFKFGQEFQSCAFDDSTRPATEIQEFRKCRIQFEEKKCFAKPAQLTWFGAGQHYVHTRREEVPLVTRLSLLHFRWRGISHMHRKCVDHISQQVLLSDGSSKLPRVGTHVLEGAQSIDSGGFRAWARKEIGTPTHIVRGLAEYLSSSSVGSIPSANNSSRSPWA